MLARYIIPVLLSLLPLTLASATNADVPAPAGAFTYTCAAGQYYITDHCNLVASCSRTGDLKTVVSKLDMSLCFSIDPGSAVMSWNTKGQGNWPK
jgi:hypothetical protein